jgi:hypothetical protein
MAVGEEKQAGGEVEAMNDLTRKLSGLPVVSYQSIPYIPVYIACGTVVQFGLLCSDGKVSDLPSLL